MRFKLQGVDQQGFDAWVAKVKAGHPPLDTRRYLALEKPSEKVPAMYFAGVEPKLFDRIYNRCVRPGTPCMSEVMRRDTQAGGGHPHGSEVGSGMPSTRGAPPPGGQKPEGALFKEGDEKGSGPNVTKPRSSDQPGNADPDSQKNRDMSYTTVPAAPGTPRAGTA
jgi:cytochrome o ubiquinol oxidase subunit 2